MRASETGVGGGAGVEGGLAGDGGGDGGTPSLSAGGCGAARPRCKWQYGGIVGVATKVEEIARAVAGGAFQGPPGRGIGESASAVGASGPLFGGLGAAGAGLPGAATALAMGLLHSVRSEAHRTGYRWLEGTADQFRRAR